MAHALPHMAPSPNMACAHLPRMHLFLALRERPLDLRGREARVRVARHAQDVALRRVERDGRNLRALLSQLALELAKLRQLPY
eukprot:820561-Prymnesium_polylepis.1